MSERGGASDERPDPVVPLASGAALPLATALARVPTPDGTPFELLFRHGTLEVEMYAPQGRDLQTPHARDEVYVVARGTARFAVEGVETRVGPGDLLFVPARTEHRFLEFSEDFAAWVVFY